MVVPENSKKLRGDCGRPSVAEYRPTASCQAPLHTVASADTESPRRCAPSEYASDPGQIGNSPGQLEDAVIGAGAQLHLLHGGFEQIGAGFVNRAELADFGRPHIGVGLQGSAFKPLLAEWLAPPRPARALWRWVRR